jgi:addiction module RelB/DinJ family antitoxin
MGLDQTTAIDMFFRQIIAENRLPFQPVLCPTLNEQIIAAVLKRDPRRVTLETDPNGILKGLKTVSKNIINYYQILSKISKLC